LNVDDIALKNFLNILATSLSVLQLFWFKNKIISTSVAKFLDISAKLFFRIQNLCMRRWNTISLCVFMRFIQVSDIYRSSKCVQGYNHQGSLIYSGWIKRLDSLSDKRKISRERNVPHGKRVTRRVGGI